MPHGWSLTDEFTLTCTKVLYQESLLLRHIQGVIVLLLWVLLLESHSLKVLLFLLLLHESLWLSLRVTVYLEWLPYWVDVFLDVLGGKVLAQLLILIVQVLDIVLIADNIDWAHLLRICTVLILELVSFGTFTQIYLMGLTNSIHGPGLRLWQLDWYVGY